MFHVTFPHPQTRFKGARIAQNVADMLGDSADEAWMSRELAWSCVFNGWMNGKDERLSQSIRRDGLTGVSFHAFMT
jgi:hypothetical protein